MLLPRVDAALFRLALAHVARDVGAGPTKQILLGVDQAGSHIADEVTVPAGIHREFLPSSSLELPPAERLWPLTNDVVANRHVADIPALEDPVAGRCRTLSAQPEVVRSHTRFPWWPTEEAASLNCITVHPKSVSLEALFAQTRQSEAEAEGYLVDDDWEAEAMPAPVPLEDRRFPDKGAADLWQRVFAGEMMTEARLTETASVGTNGRVVTFEELASVVRRPKPRRKSVPEGQLALFGS